MSRRAAALPRPRRSRRARLHAALRHDPTAATTAAGRGAAGPRRPGPPRAVPLPRPTARVPGPRRPDLPRRLPRALRPRRASTPTRPTSTCASSCSPAPRSSAASAWASRPTSSTATTGRPRFAPLLPAHALRVGPLFGAHAHRAHHPQPRLPGRLRARRRAPTLGLAESTPTCFHQDQLRAGRVNFLLPRHPLRRRASPRSARPTRARSRRRSTAPGSTRSCARAATRSSASSTASTTTSGARDGDSHMPAPLRAARPRRQGAQQGGAARTALRLPASPRVPVIGIVSRLAAQKGFALCCVDALPELLAATAIQLRRARQRRARATRTFLALAAGHVSRARSASTAASRRARALDRGRRGHVPDAVALRAVRPQPDVQPAATAPCPIVRRTGGLADTVQHCDPPTRHRHRLRVRRTSTPAGLRWALDRARSGTATAPAGSGCARTGWRRTSPGTRRASSTRTCTGGSYERLTAATASGSSAVAVRDALTPGDIFRARGVEAVAPVTWRSRPALVIERHLLREALLDVERPDDLVIMSSSLPPPFG